MFLPVLCSLHLVNVVYMSFTNPAGRTRYILMFYSFEWVFHWQGYHDKASLTMLKGVSKDFCQDTPLWRRVSGCHSTIVQQCALVRFPIIQAEKMAAFCMWHFKCQEMGFLELTLVPKEEYKEVCEIPYRSPSALFQGPF